MPAEYKLLWLYICDDCNHAGIWHVDMDVAKLRVGEALTCKKAIEVFKDKIVVFDNGDKWFIPSFIEFQYGELNEKNRVHASVLIELNKYGLLENKGLTTPLQGCKDKDKDKDKDKAKENAQVEIWNSMPVVSDVAELPEIKIGSTQQFIKLTKQVDVLPDKITGLWEVFKVQNLTGTKYYQDVGAVHSHFINWIKTQKFETAKPSEINHGANVNDRLKNITKASAA